MLLNEKAISSTLIRLGGLLAIVGGLAATTLGLLYVFQAWGMALDFTATPLQKGHYQTPVATILVIGVLAAIAALHIVQRRQYGWWEALISIAASAGVAMVVIGFFVSGLVPDTAFLLGIAGLLTVGVVVASTGIVLLGIVTITARVLPRWCGIALIAGSPPGVAILFMFLAPLAMVVGNLPPGSGQVGWALAGIPWIVVGYAVFRAATHQTELSSRVQ
jgi:hypothetical protein